MCLYNFDYQIAHMHNPHFVQLFKEELYKNRQDVPLDNNNSEIEFSDSDSDSDSEE